MTIDQAELVKLVVAIIGSLLMLLVIVIGWLLRRAILQLDDKLDDAIEIGFDNSERLVRVETHLGFNVPQKHHTRRVNSNGHG